MLSLPAHMDGRTSAAALADDSRDALAEVAGLDAAPCPAAARRRGAVSKHLRQHFGCLEHSPQKIERDQWRVLPLPLALVQPQARCRLPCEWIRCGGGVGANGVYVMRCDATHADVR